MLQDSEIDKLTKETLQRHVILVLSRAAGFPKDVERQRPCSRTETQLPREKFVLAIATSLNEISDLFTSKQLDEPDPPEDDLRSGAGSTGDDPAVEGTQGPDRQGSEAAQEGPDPALVWRPAREQFRVGEGIALGRRWDPPSVPRDVSAGRRTASAGCDRAAPVSGLPGAKRSARDSNCVFAVEGPGDNHLGQRFAPRSGSQLKQRSLFPRDVVGWRTVSLVSSARLQL